MLLYIYNVTYNLFISVTVITLFYALSSYLSGKTGKIIMLSGIGAGLLAAAYRAVRHAFMSTRDVQINLNTFYVGIVAMALMLISMLVFCRKSAPKWGKAIVCSLGAVISADLIFYKAWEVIWAPAQFNTSGNGVLSADFMLRLAGWLLGLIMFCVYARFLYRCLMRLGTDEALWIKKDGSKGKKFDLVLVGGASALEILLLMCNFAGQILRKWRTNYKWRLSLFPKPAAKSALDISEREFAQFVGNNQLLFIIIAGVVALLPLIVLFVKSTMARGSYSNPAQARRLKSNRRHNRRWVAVAAVCFIIAIFNLTVVYALNNRTEELPDSETYLVSEDGERVLIPIEQVSDYNLHAFEMVTDNRVKVRWIVVRKPNSGAYGVGLDACDVCGAAGYIQRGDTVVCKKCDVVMNTNTIGLSGGCNPIPLSFSVEDGYLVIQRADLIAAESKFK